MFKNLLSKLELIIFILISSMVFLFLMNYSESLAKYILPEYSYFKLPLTFLFLMPSWILSMYLLLYTYYFAKYIIGFIFRNYVYARLFIACHKSTKSCKFHKKIGLDKHYWHRVIKR